jgi:OmpA-OmpF porin, OOP family
MRRAVVCIAACAIALASRAGAATPLPGLPASVTFPAGVVLYDSTADVAVENLAEVEFPLAEGKAVTKKGKHYRTYLKWTDADNKPVASFWPAWLKGLQANGWTLAGSDGSSTYSLTRKSGGQESWLRARLGDYDSPLIEVIEIAAATASLTLPAPAAQPEAIGERDDFPYLAHPADARLTGSSVRNEPLDVTGPGDRETVFAGSSYRVKSYQPPPSLSRFEFESQYREALAKAGWAVKLPEGGKAGSGEVIAHYAKGGRNLWARLGRGADDSGTGILLKVADIGAEDWGARLDKDCRLPLYGVTFDFNKDTLLPDSTSILEKAAALLKTRDKPVEIQGHTDNVGGDAYNVQLSNARAASVMRWLVAHGIPQARLTAQGFGKSQPVADNGSEAGRARNRRVELKVAGCGK